jgi:PTS hybrid protein
MSALVCLVIVSHSRALAAGVAELAGQMAPAVRILPVGGQADGTLGTSFDAIEGALEQATADGGYALVLTDLGSAVLTTESVLEFCDEEVVARVRLADAPLVEGAVAAAVAAEGGAGLPEVLAAAERAGSTFGAVPDPGAGPAAAVGDEHAVTATVQVRNAMGLHARPAALLARAMAGYDAQVQIGGVDAASVLELMGLGVTRGRELQIEARGPQASAAVDTAVSMFAEGFGEQ